MKSPLGADLVIPALALGFVLTYKTSGVFNLAFGAQAYVSAVVYFKAVDAWGWGMLPAFVLSVLVLAPALGFVLEWAIFRHLRTAPAVATLVVCIGLTIALPSLVAILIDFQPTPGVTPIGIVPDGDSVFYDPFGVYSTDGIPRARPPRRPVRRRQRARRTVRSRQSARQRAQRRALRPRPTEEPARRRDRQARTPPPRPDAPS